MALSAPAYNSAIMYNLGLKQEEKDQLDKIIDAYGNGQPIPEELCEKIYRNVSAVNHLIGRMSHAVRDGQGILAMKLVNEKFRHRYHFDLTFGWLYQPEVERLQRLEEEKETVRRRMSEAFQMPQQSQGIPFTFAEQVPQVQGSGARPITHTPVAVPNHDAMLRQGAQFSGTHGTRQYSGMNLGAGYIATQHVHYGPTSSNGDRHDYDSSSRHVEEIRRTRRSDESSRRKHHRRRRRRDPYDSLDDMDVNEHSERRRRSDGGRYYGGESRDRSKKTDDRRRKSRRSGHRESSQRRSPSRNDRLSDYYDE